MKYLALLLLVLIPQSASAQVMFFPIGWQLEAPTVQPASKVDQFIFDHFGKAIQKWALKNQILDPRENRYVLSHAADFKADWKLLIGRYRELKNAPYVQEADRWPERSLVNEMMTFNRAYRSDIIGRLALDTIHEEELRATLTEIDQLYRIWDAVRDARCDYYYITVRRQALENLRTLIGDQAYYSGTLPPYVPIWRIPVWE